jgi:hypothetical protein
MLSVLGPLIIGGFLLKHWQERRIRGEMVVVHAEIRNFYLYDRYLHHRLDYCFYPKNSTARLCSYTLQDNIPLDKAEAIIGRHSLVVYQKDNPKNNRILLKESDFNDYGVTPPDSLRWLMMIADL